MVFSLSLHGGASQPPPAGCPEAAAIAPCECNGATVHGKPLLSLDCSFVSDQDLDRVFSAKFPVTDLISLYILGNEHVTRLLEIRNGLTFKQVDIFARNLEIVGDKFLANSTKRLQRLVIDGSSLTQNSFPFSSLPLYEKLQLFTMSHSPNLGAVPIFNSSSINEVYFQYNELRTIPNDVFNGVSSLEMAYLQFNSFSEILPQTFKVRAGQRNFFILQYNVITRIHPGAFVLPDAGEDLAGTCLTIGLWDNHITTLEESVYKPLLEIEKCYLYTVDVAVNPVECDCGVAWLVTAPEGGGSPYSSRIQGSCADGRFFSDLTAEDFANCSSPLPDNF